MIRVLIADSNPSILAELRKLITQNFGMLQVIAECSVKNTLIKTISECHPQLVFISCRMADIIADYVRSNPQPAVFETVLFSADPADALLAIKYDALYFLPIPFTIESIANALNRYCEKKYNARETEWVYKMVSLLKQMPREIKITLPTAAGFDCIAIADIVHCNSESNYTAFYLTDSKKIITPKTLKDFEPILERFGFLRIHKSHLINMNHVSGFARRNGGLVLMADGSEIQLARRRKVTFIERFLV